MDDTHDAGVDDCSCHQRQHHKTENSEELHQSDDPFVGRSVVARLALARACLACVRSGFRSALDVHQYHGIGERPKCVFGVAFEIEVIIHLHGVPGAVRMDVYRALQAQQRDGAGDGVGRELLAFRHAQAHDFEIGCADDCLRLNC